jgi:hypothetical protein
MKIYVTYISIFLLLVLGFLIAIDHAPSPEQTILGEWKELNWEYERVDKMDDTLTEKVISDDVKKHIGQHLVIHEAETWQFLPNGRLKLISSDDERIVRWRIKGRGHILQIKYDDEKIVENYNLTELDENTMVLNFDSDLQARGIAKLTFQRNL